MAPSDRLSSCSGTFTTSWLLLELLFSQIMWKVLGRGLSSVPDGYTTLAEQFEVARELYLAKLTLLLERDTLLCQICLFPQISGRT